MHLLQQATIADPESPHNGRRCDIRIVDGRIAALADQLDPEPSESVIDLAGAYVSPGFVDIGPYLGDPGHEEREDMSSLAAAAQRGGYVAIAPLPNTNPVRHDKSGIRYLVENSRTLPVRFLPLGAISRNTSGEEITEMMDMQQAGAVAFTDGLHPVASAGLLSRALHYVKSFGGTIINHPANTTLAPGGLLHEGLISTQLGLRGIPVLCETLPLHRDLEILAYADSRLLVHLISSAAALPLLAAAKANELRVTASVGIHHLQFTVEALSGFDNNFKMLPPLREEADRQALIAALADGTIDCIVSNHIAHQIEGKELEFAYAEFGALGLETCFAQACTVLAGAMGPDQISAFFNHGPRRALGLLPQTIAVGEPAELSCFRMDANWTVQANHFAGLGVNSPLLGRELNGRPIGTYFGGSYHPIPE